jgi:hypothetical protein
MMRLRYVLAAVALATLASAPATPVAGSSPSRSAGPNGQAVVVIGNSEHVVQVGGGMSGIAALRSVADVVTLNYGGSLGEAVCEINGVGDAAQPSSCPGGWRYYRAANGASGWTYSGAGPSNTTVRPGDVEGWGYNSTPPFRPFCSVAQCAPPPPPPGQGGPIPGGAFPAPGGNGGGNGSSGPNGGRPAPGTPGTPSGPGAPGETGAPEEPTATTAAPDTTTTDGKNDSKGEGGSASRARRARVASDDSPGPGSPLSFIIFGVVLVALVAGVFVLRWSRRRLATAPAGAPEPGASSEVPDPASPADDTKPIDPTS